MGGIRAIQQKEVQDSKPPAISAPPPALLAIVQHQDEMIASFWGGRTKTKPHEARSYNIVATEREDVGFVEPNIFTKKVFFYGCVFFPFWIMGIVCLWSLSEEADLELGILAGEKAERSRAYLATELRWAKRCLWAMVAMLLIIGMVIGCVLATRV